MWLRMNHVDVSKINTQISSIYSGYLVQIDKNIVHNQERQTKLKWKKLKVLFQMFLYKHS